MGATNRKEVMFYSPSRFLLHTECPECLTSNQVGQEDQSLVELGLMKTGNPAADAGRMGPRNISLVWSRV